MSTGTGMSGNTAWFNSVRSQLYLKTAATKDGDEPDPDLRELEAKKSNYGPLAKTTLLRWNAGVFVVEQGEGSLERMAVDNRVDDAFLKILARFNRQGRNVGEKKGPTYAPALFSQEPEAKEAAISREALAKAMTRLFSTDAIHLEPYGPPCRRTARLVVGGKT
jgi:RecA-family ATPase